MFNKSGEKQLRLFNMHITCEIDVKRTNQKHIQT